MKQCLRSERTAYLPGEGSAIVTSVASFASQKFWARIRLSITRGTKVQDTAAAAAAQHSIAN